MSRKSKKLSREEQEEVEAWIYQNNTEETRITDTMTVNVKCKTENQKLLVNSIKEKLAITIKQIVESNKASFAFPSSSIYIEKK